MVQIKQYSFSRFKNDEAYAFYMSVEDFAKEVQIPEMAPGLKQYSDDFNALKAAMDKALVENMTALAKQADENRDNAWSGAFAYIKSMALYHPNEEVRAHSKIIYTIFENYGNPTALAVAEETSILDNLIESLQLKQEDMAAARFEEWFTHLKNMHQQYLEAAKNKTMAQSQKVVGAVKTARAHCESSYQTLVTLANAFNSILKNEALENFARHVNVLIDAQKALAKTRNSAKSSKNDGGSNDLPSGSQIPSAT